MRRLLRDVGACLQSIDLEWKEESLQVLWGEHLQEKERWEEHKRREEWKQRKEDNRRKDNREVGA